MARTGRNRVNVAVYGSTSRLRRLASCWWLVTALGLLAGPAVRAAEFDPWTQAALYELEYRVDLSQLLSAKHKSVRVWLATPADGPHQELRSKEISSPLPYREAHDEWGNRFVYLELGAKDAPPASSQPAELVLRCVVLRSPDDGVRPADIQPGKPLDPQRHLGPQKRVPLSQEVQEIADRESRECKNDSAKIRAFYDYVLRSMRYDKRGAGWGQGDIQWACRAGYGNCTDFHSLFSGLARAEKIPTRFVIGFPLAADQVEADVTGYHCWAEAYDRQRGWIPIDASEAWKAKRPDAYFGKLPSDRIAFTVGRDLMLEPRQAGDPLNFFVYPYAEADSKPVEHVPWKLHYRRLEAHAAGG